MKRTLYLGLIIFLSFIFTNNLYADVFISPIKYDINANKGDIVTRTISIFNNSDEVIKLVPGKVNIESDGISGVPKIVYDKFDLVREEQQLADWITIRNNEEFTIDAFSQKYIEFDISIPDDAKEGGHYGIVSFTTLKNIGTYDFDVLYGPIILLNVEGEGVKKELELEEIGINSKKNNIEFEIIIENTGTTHIIPEGKITLYDKESQKISSIGQDIIYNNGVIIGEKIVDYLPLNKFLGAILPGTKRTYKVKTEIDLSMYNNEYLEARIEIEYNDEEGEKKSFSNNINFKNISNLNIHLFTKNELIRKIDESTLIIMKIKQGNNIIKILDTFIKKSNEDKLNNLIKKLDKLSDKNKNHKKYKHIFSYLEYNILLKLNHEKDS